MAQALVFVKEITEGTRQNSILRKLTICHKPSVFQAQKMFGFDFETCLTDMTVSGNLQLACLAQRS